jgi:leucyl aminopeptidase
VRGNATSSPADARNQGDYPACSVRIDCTRQPAAEIDSDLVCIGLCEGEELPEELRSARGAADARGGFKKLAILRPDAPERVLVVGLGRREELDPERLRVAAALAVKESRRYRAESISWSVPAIDAGESALVEGTVMAAYRFDRYRSGDDEEAPGLGRLILSGVANPERAEVARIVAEAANRARELQNLPANVADPGYLVERAHRIATEHDSVTVEVLDRAAMRELGMGGLLAVSAGSAADPALIVLRHQGSGGRLALVGKAVTFDTGGISLKPAQGMEEMKMDMSGGAVVLEATAAIAELGLDLDLIAAVPAVENMPSGTATRPGDIITQLNGTTVEVNNTDAEGRLILADALTWCARQGAERMIDIATLTGAVVTALGSTHAAVIGNDEELVGSLEAAGRRSGELLWRLPLHPEYAKLMKGTAADLTNSAPKRKAGTITAAAFLERFTEGVNWAHIDIAGTSWDVGREYVGKGATGFGVRLLVEAARSLAADGRPQAD